MAFNDGPRKNGNTAISVKQVLRELEKKGVETELIQLSGEKIHGCVACYKCFSRKD